MHSALANLHSMGSRIPEDFPRNDSVSIVALVMPLVMPVISLFMSLVLLFSVILAMTRLIIRNIDIIIPLVTHEIDRSVTSIIFTAVLAPFFLMTGRDVQVSWLINNTGRRSLNHDGFRVNELGLRKVSNVNTAIEAGLADADGHADIGCLC